MPKNSSTLCFFTDNVDVVTLNILIKISNKNFRNGLTIGLFRHWNSHFHTSCLGLFFHCISIGLYQCSHQHIQAEHLIHQFFHGYSTIQIVESLLVLWWIREVCFLPGSNRREDMVETLKSKIFICWKNVFVYLFCNRLLNSNAFLISESVR